MEQADLASQFPFLNFPTGTQAVFEPNAGYINPRALVRAQTIAAQRAGATVVRCQIIGLRENANSITVTSIDGQTYTASSVIVAAGAFTNQLLPDPVNYRIAARTVVLFELDQVEVLRLDTMPSLIHMPDNDGPYLLPPISYPDGKIYLKIGGDPVDHFLHTPKELTAWFQSDGFRTGRDYLIEKAKALLPGLRYNAVRTAPCVTTLTPSDKPIIQHQSKRIIVLTGGNGASAKSSDEIGRLAACLANGCDLSREGYSSGFRTL